jgi:hypothetical protein
MATNDDRDTLARGTGPRSPSAIAELFRQPAKPALVVPETAPDMRSPEGGGPESFDPEDADYKAFGWAGNKTLPSLRIILKDGSEKGCLYSHLDSECPVDGCEFIPSAPGRKGNVIRLRFAGHSSVFMVIIEGVRVRRVWELLMAHQTPWIRELPTDVDFKNDNEPVMKSITFKAVKADAAEG